jgi:pSer/pThr/pTyr-binding forkhead associated (FHA) protein
MNCDNCGCENSQDVNFCRDCGFKLNDGAKVPKGAPTPAALRTTCEACGVANPDSMTFCKQCGRRLATQGSRSNGKRKELPRAVPQAANRAPVPATNRLAPVAPANPAPEKKRPAETSGNASTPRCCPNCQAEGSADAQFCKFCGCRLPGGKAPSRRVAETVPPPSRSGLDAESMTPTGAMGTVETGQRPCRLVAIRKDGSRGQVHELAGDAIDIGRQQGHLQLPNDPYLSPRHARVLKKDGPYLLKDLGSTNGIFLRLRESWRLQHGDMLLVGQQMLFFEILADGEQGLGPASQHGTLLFGTPADNCTARLAQITTEGIARDVYHLRRPETIIGREGPDIIFADDPFMSRRHARITYDGKSRAFVLEDLGSFNGTSIRFRGERELRPGDQFRVGNHLFLFEPSGDEP